VLRGAERSKPAMVGGAVDDRVTSNGNEVV